MSGQEPIPDGVANLVVIVRPEAIARRDLFEKALFREFGGFRASVAVKNGEEPEKNFRTFSVFCLEMIVKDILHVPTISLVAAGGEAKMCL